MAASASLCFPACSNRGGFAGFSSGRRVSTQLTPRGLTIRSDMESNVSDMSVNACDVPGIKRLVPRNWREWEFFDNIFKLIGVPVVTVQHRYNGWITELRDLERAKQLRQAAGLDNLLYTLDADFSCFADLALTSPEDYYFEGQGSLLQCVLTPGDPYMPLPNDEIIKRVSKQVVSFSVFPRSRSHMFIISQNRAVFIS
ncbi:zeta-carotene desaturase, chloroplastic/chromoplastic-like [Primulina eburnea]|uniref:zeta-carotene desaturase, chloroplastic/chromoplastic-like n=1 Tax=Primulina eburnea TaxID=1245227 RepID=UPI003C6C8DA0